MPLRVEVVVKLSITLLGSADFPRCPGSSFSERVEVPVDAIDLEEAALGYLRELRQNSDCQRCSRVFEPASGSKKTQTA